MKFLLEIPVDSDALRYPGGAVDLDAVADRMELVIEHLRAGRFLRYFLELDGSRTEMRCEITDAPEGATR